MKITITIPNDKKTAVVDAFATQYNYQTNIIGDFGEYITNPVSKGVFALNIIKNFIKEVYVAAQVKPISETVKDVAETANTEIDVITVN